MPNINEMLLKLEGLQYVKSLDLDMGYYHIQITEDASNLCTIITSWEKYCHKHLLMGVYNWPDILQQKMNDLFQLFEFIHAYRDKLLILIKWYWKDNVHKLELTLNKLKEIGLKYNIEKYFFGKPKWNI